MVSLCRWQTNVRKHNWNSSKDNCGLEVGDSFWLLHILTVIFPNQCPVVQNSPVNKKPKQGCCKWGYLYVISLIEKFYLLTYISLKIGNTVGECGALFSTHKFEAQSLDEWVRTMGWTL